MNSPLLQLLVLAGIAVFLILRLRSVLGTREGFEKPRAVTRPEESPRRRGFEVIEGGPDRDIIDHVPEGSDSAQALAEMKRAEPEFGVADFLQGARGAYEMILMAFERGDIEEVKPYLDPEVYESFEEVVAARNARGLKVEAEFLGVREIRLQEARYDAEENWAEITVRFVGELTSAVRDASGEIVEGDPRTPKRQKDLWTFARRMGVDDPNWQLVATGE